MIFLQEQAKLTGERLLVLLPAMPGDPSHDTHWWFVSGEAVADQGEGSEWIDLSLRSKMAPIGLAPTSALRLHFARRPDDATSDRQATAVARMEALETLAADPETVHSATASLPGNAETLVTALVANDRMLSWIEWGEAASLDLAQIVPAALAAPVGAGVFRAQVGNDRFIAGSDRLFADEPGLADLLLEPGTELAEADPSDIEAGLVRLAANPAPDLRSGPFARRKILIESGTLRQLALIAAAIVLVMTLTAIVEILRLNQSTARLNAETLEVARGIAGNEVTLETAEQAVASRTGGAGGLGVPLAAMLTRLQTEQAVTATSLGYGNATTSVTLAGPDQQSINRVLLDLQRDGYAVTAIPRQGSGGRTMADVTIRTVR